MPSYKHWVSYHRSGIEYHRVIIFIFTSKTNYSEHENKIQIYPTSWSIKFFKHHIIVEMHHMISTFIKILLWCYSLSLMKWRVVQWQPVTWFQILSELISLVINASVSQFYCLQILISFQIFKASDVGIR